MYNQLQVPSDQVNDSIMISTGWDYSCSINIYNKLSCWGLNMYGQSDTPHLFSEEGKSTSQEGRGIIVGEIRNESRLVRHIATGLSHSCAI